MKKSVLRIVYTALLLVVTTFAWVLTSDVVKVDRLFVDYSHGNLLITNANIEATFLIYDATTDTYKTLVQMEEEAEERGEVFVLGGGNMVPGSAIFFKIRLKNTAGNTTQTNLTMYLEVPKYTRADFPDLTDEEIALKEQQAQQLLEGVKDEDGNISKAGLFSKLFIEVKPGLGYYGTAMDSLYIRFDDADRVVVDGVEQYALGLYGGDSKLLIPTVDSTAVGVELECSIYFDEEADYTYQDIGFAIDYFRMEQ